MVDKAIIIGVRRYLNAVNEGGIRVSFGVIFGSQTRGGATEESDIDLLVVSPVFDGARTLDNVGELWYCAAKTNSRIEPIPCGEKQWVEDDGSPIIEVARQQGEIVNLSEGS